MRAVLGIRLAALAYTGLDGYGLVFDRRQPSQRLKESVDVSAGFAQRHERTIRPLDAFKTLGGNYQNQ